MEQKGNTTDKTMMLGEERIKVLHDWISRLCDPEINFCLLLHSTFESTCEGVVERNYAGGGGSFTELANKKIPTNIIPNGLIIDQVQDGAVYSNQEDGAVFEGNYKKGVPHGYFRSINSDGDVDLFCCFVRGILHGLCWKGLPGGGFLVSPSCEFSAEGTLYLYPDCRTVLFGSFYKGQLVQGQLCEVVGSTAHCSYFCGAMKPVLSEPHGKIYSYDPSTSIRISSEPLLPDPYEAEFVEVLPSTIPRAGEGLFAKVEIEVGTVISFYNGTRVEPAVGTERLEKDDYRIVLDEEYDLDIPSDMLSTDSYCASLAHKVCHSFHPNTEFDTFHHPRFGLIRCLATLRDIRCGEELFVDYHYSLSISPNWYKVAWAKHQKVVRKLPNWKLAVNYGSFSTSQSSGIREETRYTNKG